MRAARYDAIVIGAGHNGLVAACYLARAGLRVLVLERRPLVGGACVTEETFPGFKVSTAAYVVSLFHKETVRDLRLAAYGFEVLPRTPSSFTPYPDERYLLLGADPATDQKEISKFSRSDAERYPEYCAMLERVAAFVEPTLTMTPPNLVKPGIRDVLRLVALGRSLARCRSALAEITEMLSAPASGILDRWFESTELKATLATDAIIGAMASPATPGTGYVLLHHVMGETDGRRGVWGYVRGGMGGLTSALARAGRDLGVEIICDAEVSRILVRDGRVTGVALDNGDEYLASIVASSVDAHVTFVTLMEPGAVPTDFLNAVNRISYESASLKINVALSELPSFRACPGTEPGPQHRGTIHIAPDLEYIERAFDDAKYGRPSERPVLECTIPSVIDATVAPPGRHLMSMFVQYAPYRLRDTGWDDLREAFADRCFDVLEEYAPNFRRAVVARQVLTPLDIERLFNLTGGNIFQGAMTAHQLFALRPVPGYAGYRTPVAGLYLCGAAAHPGGGVMGLPGRNAAREILRGRRLRRFTT